ncbi:WG repeat-containing protein [Paenibacillaceae bacterium]|nr:WG repeat-containing protein [Paenibacillaceae bacterium]
MVKHIAAFVGLLVIIVGLVGTGHGKAVAAGESIKGELAGEQLYIVKANGKYGFMNSQGEIVIKPIYDGAGYSGQSGSPVYVVDRTELQQIYFSTTGDRLFDCPLNTCGVMYDGLAQYTAKIQTNDGPVVTRHGYINSKGKVVIQPIYHRAFNFVEGLARVNQGKAGGYINTEGELVIPYRYSQTTDFSDGMAAVMLSVGGKYGYINTKGELVVPPRFAHAEPFSEGVAAVYVNGKYGYIDKTGEYILPPQFSLARPFSEGLAFVERNGVTFYINTKGEKVIQNIKAGGQFSGGLAPASKGGKYGYINTSGIFVIKPQFEWADSFSGDLAEIYLNNNHLRNYQYINRSGEIMHPQ